MVACGTLYLVNKIFNNKSWSKLCNEVTGVAYSEVKACAQDLYNIMQKIDSDSLTAIKRKFSSLKYHEVSKYKIEKVKSKSN